MVKGWTKKQFSSTNSISHGSTWALTHTVPGYSLESHRLGAQSHKTTLTPKKSDVSGRSRLPPVLLTDWQYWEVLETPLLEFVNLLEQLTELRKYFTY